MQFKSNKAGPKPLTQTEREAIVDLLHLCIYADAFIALKEGEFIVQTVDAIGWETQSSFSSYESRSVASARDARKSPEGRKELLEFAAQRLTTPASRAKAIELCRKLMASDGAVENRESTLLDEIKAVLA